MKVRAVFANDTDYGFYGEQRRYSGDVFTIKDESHFSKKWMEVITPAKPRGRPKKDSED